MNIQVLTDTLPIDGYQKFCKYYNQNKPKSWMAISKAGVYEGGFEVPLSPTEISRLKERYPDRILDPNDKFRQLRWSNGWLIGWGYSPLREDETALLYAALQNVLGESKVNYKPFL